MSGNPQPINLFDFEVLAKQRLPKPEYDYIAGGATDEISVERNRRAYESWAFRPRVLRDVSKLDLSTTVLGTKINSLPRAAATKRLIPMASSPHIEQRRRVGPSWP